MNTEIIKIKAPDDEAFSICRAGRILKSGGLVAFPTETVYGLGANALDKKASAKIYQAKGRPSDNPLIIHIARMEDLDKIAASVPEAARKMAAAFWPGPLTMIFPKTDAVPRGTTGGRDTVAVRMPSHLLALKLIEAGGGFIAAPSANASGRPSPTSAAHVEEDLGGRVDMIVDGGMVEIGLESTIVDFSEQEPVILRPGYISREMIENVIGEVRGGSTGQIPDGADAPRAPGMKYKHYAPDAPLVIVEGDIEKVIRRINAETEEKEKSGKRVGVISTKETASRYCADIVKSVGMRREEESIARHLYQVLREFNEENVDFIYSESFYTPKMGQAIMNRLNKAASHQIIRVE